MIGSPMTDWYDDAVPPLHKHRLTGAKLLEVRVTSPVMDSIKAARKVSQVDMLGSDTAWYVH